MQRPIIVAHRGASALARENTLESFEKAIEVGTDMIEIDVRRTKDHILIAHHDETLNGVAIHDLTYGEIESGVSPGDGHVPRISEILALARGRVRIDADLKEGGYEGEVIELLSKYLEGDRFVLTSFIDAAIQTIKRTHPSIQAGLILGRPRPKRYVGTRFSELFPMKRVRRANADFLVPHYKLLKLGFLNRARRSLLPVYVWTVNDEGLIQRFLNDKRVHAVITDRPDVAVAMKRRMLSGPG
jgi:glycerophosphoryl diester phosphodiesterase